MTIARASSLGMDLFSYISHIRACVLEKFGSTQNEGNDQDSTPTTGNNKELDNSFASTSERDEIRREHEQLSNDLESVQRNYKKLRQVVDQLEREYEESKEFDPVRRYEKLKNMVKRTILHFKLDPDQQGSASQSQGIVGLMQGCKQYAQHLESTKRREERCSRLSREDIIIANSKMGDQIKECNRKCSIIRGLVENLERGYESSKRYVVLQRYRMLKTMIKTVIHDKWI
ncbi:hypothetical protein LOTGIDRAFT_229008 [Lottia gigantea]|uniref:Uncharacterized protein n=1 Tax=Lottia gigantea TaxID=225164 RepID=V4A728_LOTGI|nr:hypothetical protein LOTGIDRAFT_229008 [Lottia gigantea]ESO89081.1 hypothetical protein LOTGIDRAFT_229008 [Lottia gigantea]